MFTSRSEFRLSARADNADMRLTQSGRSHGVVGDKRWRHFQDEKGQMDELRSLLENKRLGSHDWIREGVQVNQDSEKRSAFDILRLNGMSIQKLAECIPGVEKFSEKIARRVEIEGKLPLLSVSKYISLTR